MPVTELSELRVQQCREAARVILRKHTVAAPDEIDLETIAWEIGRLRIKFGGLDNAEGRIVASKQSGGVIRVSDVVKCGRQRFTIAHEIGHYLLHPRDHLDKDDTTQSFSIWKDRNEEAEANVFAAELLMPEFLFASRCCGPEPCLSLIDRLAEAFSTSVMATAFQYITYTSEQVALVVSHGKRVKWFHRSKDFWPWIRMGEVHQHSAAGERLAGIAGDTTRMVSTPAYAWLADFEEDQEHNVMEDSRYLDWYDRMITLLWLKDDLEE